MRYISAFIIISLLFSNCTSNSNEILLKDIIEKNINSKYYNIKYSILSFEYNEEPITLNDSINNFLNNEINNFKKSIDNDAKFLINSGNTKEKYSLNIQNTHYITSYGVISIMFELQYYSLGAHSNIKIKTLNFDLQNNSFLNLTDLGNFKNVNELNSFNILLQKHFVNTNSCFTEQPNITDSYNKFTIEEDSITVYFEPYELGDYKCGGTEIKIPISELP